MIHELHKRGIKSRENRATISLLSSMVGPGSQISSSGPPQLIAAELPESDDTFANK